MKEIRIDDINNDIVIFAKDRAKRPMDKVISENEEEIIDEYNKDCPFCRGNEHYTPESRFKIEDENGWTVRSTDNKFPIVDKFQENIYGSHEVMIDTYRHNGNFYNMNEDEFYNMLLMYRDRYSNLIKDEKVQYVSIFKNYLRKAGASLNHPHSQIVSISIIPPDIERELYISKQYYIENKRYLYDDIINEEIREKDRVINNSERFLTVVPRSTKYTGEIRILFKKSIRFENTCNEDIKELSKILKNLFSNLFKVNGNSPFNIFIHSHPKNIKSDYFNVHIHIIPRQHSFGGFELGTGLYVSSIEPKEIADKIKF
ncbi:DUF4931 domain-containing protein [Romboutsia ilealis]|uniref:Galactose-1-phosphate uridylyltransferase n=1 Tax=Romboutsia ilealis TaxID=1115758 RepID=A0A1V1I2F0_9FIRM|nr:DUF4931 domain-containing protein [Romboutsia ilealis]CED94388.1 Galactose-1-phosphate uridylyltransferase [Romboutsia ilealis]